MRGDSKSYFYYERGPLRFKESKTDGSYKWD